MFFFSTSAFQVHGVQQQKGFRRQKRGLLAAPSPFINEITNKIKESTEPTDPFFPFQWYLVSQRKEIVFFIVNQKLPLILSSSSHKQKNVGQNGGKPRLDLNVEAAWAQGFTGRNITTAIMDDGKQKGK